MKQADIKNIQIFDAMLYYGTFDLTSIDTVLPTLAGKELATSESGVSVSIEPDIYDIKFAGKRDKKFMGTEVIVGQTGTVEGEVIVINSELLEMSLYKSSSTSSTKFVKYVPKTGLIEDATYKDLLVVGTTVTGDNIIVHVKNTYNSNPFEMNTKDKEEAKVKVKYEAHYSLTKPNEDPIEIFIPKPVSAAALVGEARVGISKVGE